MKNSVNEYESLGAVLPRTLEDLRPVQSWELLSLAFIPREEALKIAGRSAQQFAERQKPAFRTFWNYRCDRCRSEGPVYRDNNVCWDCEHGDGE